MRVVCMFARGYAPLKRRGAPHGLLSPAAAPGNDMPPLGLHLGVLRYIPNLDGQFTVYTVFLSDILLFL